MNWQTSFDDREAHVRMAGFIAGSEKDCRRFFQESVAAKLAEGDGAEVLRDHLVELTTTGFDLTALQAQLQQSPPPKDWEVGEALAEAALELGHEALFPWPTGFDKRAVRASLPGADLVGLQNHAAPRFVFGQVKSSSENRVPPQVVDSGQDCLARQMHHLRHRSADRQQLIQWLLVRARDTDWESAFNEALERYAKDEMWLVGVLVSGQRDPDHGDLRPACAPIAHDGAGPEVGLFGFYLPFHKDEWLRLLEEASS